jgi:WD40 repeat protein
VSTLRHRALGVAPTAVEQPEPVVAEGSLQATAGAPAEPPAPPVPVPATPFEMPPATRSSGLTLEGHDAPVHAVVFGPDGTLATAGEGGQVQVWAVPEAVPS